MSNNHFKDQRPTPLEEQAYADAKLHFADHLKQFTAGRDAIQRLDETLIATAQAATKNAIQPSQRDSIQTEDGTRLHRCANVAENICVCHCPSADGGEFAVVESLPLKSGELREILAKGRDAMEALNTFISDQREALRLWAADASAQVREYLAKRYPAHDLCNVANAIGARFTCVCPRTTESETTQKRDRGIRI